MGRCLLGVVVVSAEDVREKVGRSRAGPCQAVVVKKGPTEGRWFGNTCKPGRLKKHAVSIVSGRFSVVPPLSSILCVLFASRL